MRRTTLGIAALASAALVGGLGVSASAHPAAVGQPDLAAAIGLGDQEQLIVKDVVTDSDGSRNVRYNRTYHGLKVLGGDLVVRQDKAGQILATYRASTAKLDVATTPAIAAPQAAQAAGSLTEQGVQLTSATPTLVVWASGDTDVLAWETIVTGMQADQTPSELHVVTDATSGTVLDRYETIEHVAGTGNSEYSGVVTLQTTKSGTVYQLKDPTRGNQQVNNLNHGSGSGSLMTDADNIWGNGLPSNVQTAGVDAAYGAQSTWDYYKNVHGRNGIKNNGVGAQSRVHYSNNYVNAFWSDSCFCMTYGDGSGNLHPLTALDVAGHEMSHGVTSATAGLIYSGESGGLNEATSDIFGSSVEFAANNATDKGDYLIGEKIDINGDGTPLRYMDKPAKDGASADCWFAGIGNLDVHYSSGPANHMFYLLSEGSGTKVINGVTYNSPTCNGSTVTGITRAKAEKIWYRALTVKFTSTTNYKAARTGSLAAAADLYGTGSTEYNAVAAAFSAINVT